MTSTYPGEPGPAAEPTNPFVRAAHAVENLEALDPVVRRVSPLAEGLVAAPAVRDALQGRWLGHAVHPLLVTMPLGMWTAVGMLDLVGGESGRDTARTLTGWGVLLAVPSAVTGWAEWAGANQRDRRTGTVHAATNATGILLYTASWRARRRGRHGKGAVLAALGYGAVNVGGFFGGHLTQVRKVGSHHPAFAED